MEEIGALAAGYVKAYDLRKEIRNLCAYDLKVQRKERWAARRRFRSGETQVREFASDMGIVSSKINVIRDYADHIDRSLSFLRKFSSQKGL